MLARASGTIDDHALFCRSYVQTYLQRDLRELTRVGDEAAFLRFLRACAARTGQLLNMSDLARDADVSVNTAKNWLSILETSFQVFLLYPVEVKKSATPQRQWVRTFERLASLDLPVGRGAVVCLAQQATPITRDVEALPVGWI